eukprot:2787701-Pleurochrysis_carterae.AAC.1
MDNLRRKLISGKETGFIRSWSDTGVCHISKTYMFSFSCEDNGRQVRGGNKGSEALFRLQNITQSIDRQSQSTKQVLRLRLGQRRATTRDLHGDSPQYYMELCAYPIRGARPRWSLVPAANP